MFKLTSNDRRETSKRSEADTENTFKATIEIFAPSGGARGTGVSWRLSRPAAELMIVATENN